MEDTKHIFNVVFTMPLRSPNDPYAIANVHTFNVLPIYWSIIIVEGHGIVTGETTMQVSGNAILSASTMGISFTTACALPNMVYSASIVLTGCTIFAACPVLNLVELVTY